MVNLGFKIVRTPYPSASKMTGTIVQKVRDDGRVGAIVGDEALLWDALEEARREVLLLRQANENLQEERDRLLQQVEQRKGKR